MTNEEFNKLVDELDGTSLQTLKDKNARYTANSGDALHNFRLGAQTDGSTMAQTVWHYWKKHFVALMDKIQTNDWTNREDTKEKIQDSINYLRFIWAISEEERNKQSNEKFAQEENNSEEDCMGCAFEDVPVEEFPCSQCQVANLSTEEESYLKFPSYFRQKP